MRAPRDPRLITMSDSVSRIRNASRSVGRDTSNWCISSTSDGRLSPSASSPRTILLRRYEAIISPVFAARMFWPTCLVSLITGPSLAMSLAEPACPASLAACRARLFRPEPMRAVEADHLAVEVVVAGDVLHQGRVLIRPAHPARVGHGSAPPLLRRLLRAPEGRREERAGRAGHDPDAERPQPTRHGQAQAHDPALLRRVDGPHAMHP